MKQQFIVKNFKLDTIDLIREANLIVQEYSRQGFVLTLRQLYYQFVARGKFPDDRRYTWTGAKWKKDANGTKNAQPNYKWLGKCINDGRLAGLVDWLSIEDRTRNLVGNAHWLNAVEAVQAVEGQFRIDLWARQPHRVEVWIEKEALTGVISGVCNRLDVPFLACRGFVSQSEMWRGFRRSENHPVILLHLGDHDPSGMDMTRDNRDRLNDVFGGRVEVRRLALNMDQIEEQNPPSDPAKSTDSRFPEYRRRYGPDSWELDALEPAFINDLIETNVKSIRDDGLWREANEEQEAERQKITDAIEWIGNQQGDAE